MEKHELQNRKGQKIIGILEMPEGGIRGTCIVQHGWGSNRNSPTVLAMKNGFLVSGFQTFTFDTTNSFGESDGNFEQSTLGSFWEDLEDVVKWAQSQKWFIGPLALSGHSKGGYSVARYAEEYPKEVSYLVPVAPVVSGKLSFESHRKRDPEGFVKWQKEGVLETTSKDGKIKRKHWFQMEERLNHDLLPHADKLKMPMLLIVGSRDESCFEQTEILFNTVPEGEKSLVIIEGAPHSFYEEEEQKQCEEVIKKWLQIC